MMSKLTLLKASFLSLLIFSAISASAGTYPVYVTQSGTVTLGPKNLGIGEKVVWVEVTGGTNKTLVAADGVTPEGNLVIAKNSPVGEHTYNVHVVSANPANCHGDVAVYKIYVLPDPVVTLSDASLPLYCENAGATSTFTATASLALPDGVTYNYGWEGTFAGTPVTDLSTWGVYDISTDYMSSTFTFGSTNVGKYTLTAKINYVVPGTSVLRTGDGAGEIRKSGAKPIEVSAKPAEPVIEVIM